MPYKEGMSIYGYSESEFSGQNLVDVVGGKGFNLMQLSELSRGRDFRVPPTCIIPIGLKPSFKDLGEIFDSLQKPLVVRSSSPWEDQQGHSFAGLYNSYLRVDEFHDFEKCVTDVQRSAYGLPAFRYASQHNLEIDERMAVVVQEMVMPFYAGVCYSNLNPKMPATLIEYDFEIAEGLMSGNMQGEIVRVNSQNQVRSDYTRVAIPQNIIRVASTARELESIYRKRLDIEFVMDREDQLYIVQARPVTDFDWPDIVLPKVNRDEILLTADIVRGSGIFTGPAFVLLSPTENHRSALTRNSEPYRAMLDQWHLLREFNYQHPEGFCLITDTLENHKNLLEQGSLTNLSALVTVNLASRFSHPAKIVAETGAFYIGVVGRTDLLHTIETGDVLTVASDKSTGLVFGQTKPTIELSRANIENLVTVPYADTRQMDYPSDDEVDDHVFLDPTGEISIKIWDYNEVGGIPTAVYYDLIIDGFVVKQCVYDQDKAIYRFPNFIEFIDYAFNQAINH